MFTMPATSHSDNWFGIPFASCVLLFGAFRVARVGATPGTCFVYGCASALLYLPRFLGMGRFRLWLQYQAPSTEVIVFQWIGLSLMLGAICAGIAMAASANDDEEPPTDTGRTKCLRSRR